MLGRGELYLEFIRRTHVVKGKGKSKGKDTEPDMRDFAKTFEVRGEKKDAPCFPLSLLVDSIIASPSRSIFLVGST